MGVLRGVDGLHRPVSRRPGTERGRPYKVPQSADQLKENAEAILDAILRARPAAAKGKYLKSVSVSSTMGPGVRVDEAGIVLSEG